MREKNGITKKPDRLRQFLQENVALLLRTIAAFFALCILGSTLFLIAACSSQGNIVNPSADPWRIVHSMNLGSAKNALNAVAATSVNDAWAVGAFSNSHFNVPGEKP